MRTDKDRKEIRGLVHDMWSSTTQVLARESKKLDFEPGDVLHVKLGDPACGWISGPEHEERQLQLWRQLLKEFELDGKVPVVITHYGVEVDVFRAKADEARAQLDDDR